MDRRQSECQAAKGTRMRINMSWRSGRRAVTLGGALAAAASFSVAGVHASTPSLARTSLSPVSQRAAAVFWSVRARHPAVPAGPAAALPLPSFTYLSGVFCTSAANCWAVGVKQSSAGSAMLNQVLHWNGRKWQKAVVPNPAGTSAHDVNELFAVRCLNARSCWTVGEDSPGGAVTFNQALYWNGRKWSKVSTPNPGGSKAGEMSELFDVTCTSSANCWTVGDFGTSPGSSQKLLNQVLHWNGKTWSRIRVVNPAGTKAAQLNSLEAVRCGSAASCNAVGDYGTAPGSTDNLLNQVLHWNGKRWYKVGTPNPGGAGYGKVSLLTALACGSSTSCWGAGSYGTYEPTDQSQNEILHWNGTKWTKSTTPTLVTSMGASSLLVGATCYSSRDCWAVGSQDGGLATGANEALHWNGKRWSLVSTPNPGAMTGDPLNLLLSARCTSPGNCWAVGVQEPTAYTYQDEILHWNGKKWSVG
jgi:hypothetical protein